MHQLDSTLSTWLAQIFPHNPTTVFVFSLFSFNTSAVAIWASVFAILLVLKIVNRKHAIVYFITMASTALLSNYILKWIFQRSRPIPPPEALGFVCPTDYSFPSAHAAISFACAVVLSRYDKKRAVFYYTLAVLISYSRIFLYCHYFFDVITGIMLGVGMGLTAIFLEKRKNEMSDATKHTDK